MCLARPSSREALNMYLGLAFFDQSRQLFQSFTIGLYGNAREPEPRLLCLGRKLFV
jgi:hypothetical protein